MSSNFMPEYVDGVDHLSLFIIKNISLIDGKMKRLLKFLHRKDVFRKVV